VVSPQAETGNGQRGLARAFRLAEKDFAHQVNVVVFADLGEAIAVEEEVDAVPWLDSNRTLSGPGDGYRFGSRVAHHNQAAFQLHGVRGFCCELY
jgi:hypothetical protein